MTQVVHLNPSEWAKVPRVDACCNPLLDNPEPGLITWVQAVLRHANSHGIILVGDGDPTPVVDLPHPLWMVTVRETRETQYMVQGATREAAMADAQELGTETPRDLKPVDDLDIVIDEQPYKEAPFIVWTGGADGDWVRAQDWNESHQ